MGIVLRQSFWASGFAYLGVVIGYINQLWLFPYFLTIEEVGLFRQVQSAALLVIPFSIFGMSSTVVKYLPQYRERNEASNFITTALIGTAIGLLLTICILFLFKEQIISFYSSKSAMVNDYLDLILGLIVILTYLSLSEAISRANLNITVPTFLKDVLVRVSTGVIIIIYGFNLITLNQALYSLLINYGFALLILIIFLVKNRSLRIPKSKFSIKPIFNNIKTYMTYAILGSAGSVIVLNIDIQMVTAMKGLDFQGIYTTAFYIAVVIEMPRRAISSIVTPIISTAFQENNFEKIKGLYKSISINQSIIGCLLFLGILINLETIFSLIPKGSEYGLGYYVVIIIGLSKLLDMTFSLNGEIIMMSKHFRFNIITVISLAVLTILFNYILIPIYGIEGAALASLAAMLMFNIIKLIFVKWKFDMIPFGHQNIVILLIGGVAYFINSVIPKFDNSLVDIIIRSSVVSFVYLGLVVLLGVSKELQDLINKHKPNWLK